MSVGLKRAFLGSARANQRDAGHRDLAEHSTGAGRGCDGSRNVVLARNNSAAHTGKPGRAEGHGEIV